MESILLTNKTTLIDKKTKIICTIGPSVESVDMIVQLINAGMDAARLNFSHGDHAKHMEYVKNIREACNITGRQIAIIQDLQGPKIRVGKLENGFITLEEGASIQITSDEIIGNESMICTTYPGLIEELKVGEILLLDDGNIKFLITDIKRTKPEVTCKVIIGGILKQHKGINIPYSALSLPSLTEKDLEDLEFAIENKFDFIAMSFVRTPDDVKLLKGILRSRGRDIPVIAKIERPEAITNIDQIIAETDLVMVARGDLGVEISVEEVPQLQKMIIKKCNDKIKPVITATQMLESMINDQSPTRAEASDVANSIMDGTDCVMLSAETSTGLYPLQSVRMMKKIIQKTEVQKKSTYFNEIFVEDSPENILHTICNSACMIAERVSAKAIIAVPTITGNTPLIISNHRPMAQIIAIGFDETKLKRLKLVWGVESMLTKEREDLQDIINEVKQKLVEKELFHKGDRIVIVARNPIAEAPSANAIQVTMI
jgi:pyruvate kinase